MKGAIFYLFGHKFKDDEDYVDCGTFSNLLYKEMHCGNHMFGTVLLLHTTYDAFQVFCKGEDAGHLATRLKMQTGVPKMHPTVGFQQTTCQHQLSNGLLQAKLQGLYTRVSQSTEIENSSEVSRSCSETKLNVALFDHPTARWGNQ